MNNKNILTKIILSDLHLYFFYGFILSIPLQIRKRFLTEHSYFAGGFSEYATFFVYLSDILLVLTFFFWLIKIIARRDGDLSRLCHIERATNRVSTIFKAIYKNIKISRGTKFCAPTLNLRLLIQNKSLLFLILFCLWLVVDLLLISEDYFSISAYQTLKFLGLATLFVYVYFNLTSFKKILITVGLLVLSGLTQSLLAISQYFLQHSVFSSKWLGEIVLSPELPGVAKIMVDGEKIMRAYGTFPHPNVLASFLLITIFLSWYLLTNYPQFINSRVKNRSYWLAKILKTFSVSLVIPSDDRSRGICKRVECVFQYIFTKHEHTALTDSSTPFARPSLTSVGMTVKEKNVVTKSAGNLTLHNKLDNLSRTLKNFFGEINSNVSRETLLSIFFTFLIFTQILALILTFSRSCWLGFFITLFVLVFISILRFLLLKKGVRGIFKIVSRETILSRDGFRTRPCKNHLLNKDILNILFLAILTIFSIIYFWPEISSRNLSKESLNNLTAINLVYHKEKLRNYPKIVSRETILGYGNFLGRDEFQTRPYSHINNVSRETLPDLENKENQIEDSAIVDRLFYNKVAINSISEYPFTGSGLGTFIFQIDDYLNVSRETFLESVGTGLKPVPTKSGYTLGSWRYQPAHNIYLLIASEIGIVGFLIFAFFIIQVCRDGFQTHPYNCVNNVSRETLFNKSSSLPVIPSDDRSRGICKRIKRVFQYIFTKHKHIALTDSSTPFARPSLTSVGMTKNEKVQDVSQAQRNLQYFLIAIFIGFLVIGLFDHYFWTLQQGRLEFWLILALIAANGKIIKNK